MDYWAVAFWAAAFYFRGDGSRNKEQGTRNSKKEVETRGGEGRKEKGEWKVEGFDTYGDRQRREFFLRRLNILGYYLCGVVLAIIFPSGSCAAHDAAGKRRSSDGRVRGKISS
jgi:hypothetical protein